MIWKAEVSGQGRRSGQKPCLEFPVSQYYGDRYIRPGRVGAGKECRADIGRAVIISVEHHEHASG